ncbi:MAG: hypothetical protein A2289_00880 [Deltaproteobacteria bacterium RIFOXYA12_FULL_58_15]|nr:MAG: hypothetical protein A2289_00880 [Deltaproteobacteria bacterium RIFOXYA12_FULL_58_15]OGR11261.1 MAG: hypothetical protein A2341_17635 [Deltaproteobacteria bacterium RIFOXYB12_FULL_58_9]
MALAGWWFFGSGVCRSQLLVLRFRHWPARLATRKLEVTVRERNVASRAHAVCEPLSALFLQGSIESRKIPMGARATGQIGEAAAKPTACRSDAHWVMKSQIEVDLTTGLPVH